MTVTAQEMRLFAADSSMSVRRENYCVFVGRRHRTSEVLEMATPPRATRRPSESSLGRGAAKFSVIPSRRALLTTDALERRSRRQIASTDIRLLINVCRFCVSLSVQRIDCLVASHAFVCAPPPPVQRDTPVGAPRQQALGSGPSIRRVWPHPKFSLSTNVPAAYNDPQSSGAG